MDLSTPKVMGIVNVTPDSFFDGGMHGDLSEIMTHCEIMLNEGADILDIGGASSRPGAVEVSLSEEIDRVIPVIEKLSGDFPQAAISIDTYRHQVAQEAINAGAHMVNDISAGEMDLDMIQTVAQNGVVYIAMHMQGTPSTMQNNPSYKDVVTEVSSYLSGKISECRAGGITDLILDPGFGFGKTQEQNFRLMKNLDHFNALGHPILAGISRKSMIQKSLGVNADSALNGTTGLHMIALEKGVSILRVHDVKEAVECVKLFNKLNSV